MYACRCASACAHTHTHTHMNTDKQICSPVLGFGLDLLCDLLHEDLPLLRPLIEVRGMHLQHVAVHVQKALVQLPAEPAPQLVLVNLQPLGSLPAAHQALGSDLILGPLLLPNRVLGHVDEVVVHVEGFEGALGAREQRRCCCCWVGEGSLGAEVESHLRVAARGHGHGLGGLQELRMTQLCHQGGGVEQTHA